MARLYAGGPWPLVEAGRGWWLVISGVPDPAHNWISVVEPSAAWRIPELVATAKLAAVPVMLAVTQHVLVQAGESLQRVAVDLAVATPHLAAELAALDLSLVKTEAEIALVATDAERAEAVATIAAAFDFDPAHAGNALAGRASADVDTDVDEVVRITVARVDGRVAAAVLTVTLDRVAYVAFAGTRPEMQGRGYGRAALIAALRRERELGARVAHLSASPAGLALYHRIGMRNVGLGPFLIHVAPSPFDTRLDAVDGSAAG
jgi:GNAT superfamily N-acetyltransferase